MPHGDDIWVGAQQQHQASLERGRAERFAHLLTGLARLVLDVPPPFLQAALAGGHDRPYPDGFDLRLEGRFGVSSDTSFGSLEVGMELLGGESLSDGPEVPSVL